MLLHTPSSWSLKHYFYWNDLPYIQLYFVLIPGWRLFDDSMVSLVSESQVMTRAGYVLFYRRRKMTVTVPTSVEDISVDEEDDNRITDTNILDEQPSGVLSVGNGQESEFADGDAVADDGCTVPSNSPSMYSLPSTRIDMDTVD